MSIRPSAATTGASAKTTFEVSFQITNTGRREGAAIAQLYIGDSHASVPRPPKELKGFSRVILKPGETGKITIPLDARLFTYFDASAHQWRADAGEFAVSVGSSSAQIELQGKVSLSDSVYFAP